MFVWIGFSKVAMAQNHSNALNVKRLLNFTVYKIENVMPVNFVVIRYTPLADTIFYKSSTPLTLWFYAIYLFSQSKKETWSNLQMCMENG